MAFPHTCVCGNPGNGDKDKAFVDTGLTVDYHGAVYICKDCFVEMALGFGFFKDDIKIKLEKEVEDLKASLESITEESVGIKRVMDNFRSMLVPNPVVDVPIVGTTPKSRHRTKSTKSSTEGEGGSSEQTDESGSTELSSDNDAVIAELLAADI